MTDPPVTDPPVTAGSWRDGAETDLALLAATAAGDHEAFARFVQRHGAEVLRWTRLQARDTAEAEDAAQEAFVAAWRSAATFAGPGSARAWLLTIARHALHRAHRRRAGEPATFAPVEVLEHAEPALETVALETGWGALAAAVGDPPEAVGGEDAGADGVSGERGETAAAVWRALAALRAEDREVLTLRDLQGLSGEETAAALGLSLAAMKSRLHRARLRFAAAWRSAHQGGGDGRVGS